MTVYFQDNIVYLIYKNKLYSKENEGLAKGMIVDKERFINSYLNYSF